MLPNKLSYIIQNKEWLVASAFFFFSFVRLRSYLHYFQQEEYDAIRFVRWLYNTRSWDRKLTFALTLYSGLIYFFLNSYSDIVIIMLLGISISYEKNPTKLAKKSLIWTMRSKRIILVAISMTLILFFFLYIKLLGKSFYTIIYLLILVQSLPLILCLANMVLFPLEWCIQLFYLNKALKNLKRVHPTVIAITGSYGKTSTKHILGHVLSQHAPTLITPGSVNTLMGICRVIIKSLTSEHRYFIVEMGAYYPQSIAKLCRRLRPHYGIITTIGIAHLERFKSREAILHAKFELAEAVAAHGGVTVVNTDPIFDHNLLKQIRANKHYIGYSQKGTCGHDSYRLLQAEVVSSGLKLVLEEDGMVQEPLYVGLYGLQQAMNVMAVYVMTARLNVPKPVVRAALSTVPQISHRLMVTQIPRGPVIIDDAYNSNPEGFDAALEVLQQFAHDGQRILVTPGLVELGDEHAELHFQLGQRVSVLVSIVLVIQSERIPTFLDGLFSTNNLLPEQVVCCHNFSDAKNWVNQHAGPGDAVLYANDLPDLYESPLRF